MPLYVSAGLPGPFRYVRRVDGGGSVAYWLLIGFWWVPLKWCLIAVIVLMIYTCKLAARLLVWLCRELAARLFPERYP
jgi:hypothetical protein